jgi:hypothetical protein
LQLVLSVFGSTHVPLHSIMPAGHSHPLLTQILPPVHALSQRLQWFAFVRVSTHAPPQSVRLAPHWVVQTLELQTW